MQDLWSILAERTHTWAALNRQALADAVWSTFVTARFARTGDPRGLEYLYPYLHSRSNMRGVAIDVAARIYEGQGPDSVADLDYFTHNTDPYIRDRSVRIVGAAVSGHGEDVVLATLAPYLNNRNHFVQRQAMEALATTLAGSASTAAYEEITRIKETAHPDHYEIDWAIARLFSGRPDEAAFAELARPDATFFDVADEAVGTLVRGAGEAWYERAYRDFFAPRLHATADKFPGFERQFAQRAAIQGLCAASPGRGAQALRRMLHLLDNRVTSYALLQAAPACFRHEDLEGDKAPLMELAQSQNVQEQRIAAVCLGKLVVGLEDEAAISLLRGLTGSKNGALRAAALKGLGWAARYTGDEDLRRLCLDHSASEETARAALGALGLIFQGSGRFDLFEDIRTRAEACRNRPVQGRRQYRPLIQAYLSVGLIYQGTGSTEPLDFLLEALRPTPVQWCNYRSAASKALVMIEFPERTLARIWGDDWL